MNRQTFHNVNLRVAQVTVAKQPKLYGSRQSSNTLQNEFLKKVGEIRALQDELLALQYQRELLLEQNHTYSEALQKRKQNNDIQEMRLGKLEQEVELHRLKNVELNSCDQNLKSLYEQINELTLQAQKKNQECDFFSTEKTMILSSNEQLMLRKKELIERRSFVEVRISEYFKTIDWFVDEDISLVNNLKVRLESLIESLEGLRSEQEKIKKQNQYALSLEKQQSLKFEYEEQLLTQRLKDVEKNEEIAKICQTQTNLDQMVEDMLLKEDELVEQLRRLNFEYESGEKNLRQTLQKQEDDWAQQRQSYERKLRELKKIYETTSFDIKQLEVQLFQKHEHIKKISIQYQMIYKLKLNLSSMQRLRQAQQKNNYLKFKLKQLKEIKQLVVQEIALTPQTRYIDERMIAAGDVSEDN